jgi:hypothetical protein
MELIYNENYTWRAGHLTEMLMLWYLRVDRELAARQSAVV